MNSLSPDYPWYTVGFLTAQGMGVGLLLQSLSGFDYRLGMVTVIGVATIYTLFGGVRAVINQHQLHSSVPADHGGVERCGSARDNRFGVESISA